MADWKSVLASLGTSEEERNEEETPVTEHKNRIGVVYSTDPHFAYKDGTEAEEPTLPPSQQKLRLAMERAGRGGKTVTIVRGFTGQGKSLNDLCKTLKQRCGVGGAVKDGVIIIQGDLRQRITDILKKEGYTQTK